MAASILEEISNHLEYLGYKVNIFTSDGSLYDDDEEDEEESFRGAENNSRGFLFFKDTPEGVIFYSGMGTNDKANKDISGFLEEINKLNQQSKVMKYYSDQNNELCFNAVYANTYSNSTFYKFMEYWEDDVGTLLMSFDLREYLDL